MLDYPLLQYVENNYGHKSSLVSDEFRVYAETFELDESISVHPPHQMKHSSYFCSYYKTVKL